jgi:SAM-dependent methyltransferase
MIRLLTAMTAIAILGAAVADDKAKPEKPKYEFRKDHDPNGTGKFYMGREIALVMGHEAAAWLERPEREEEESPALLHKALRLKPGDVVADVGAGSGYHTFRLSKVVGDKGKVYAVDIQQEMLDLINKKAKRTKRTNIETVMGEETNPKLPPDSCDLILLVDVYHEFSHPYEMTQAMVKALKPGGRLAFVEFRLEDSSVPIKLVHKMSQKQVVKEMSVHPLVWRTTLDVLPWQHLIIFEKPGAAALKKAGSEGKQ